MFSLNRYQINHIFVSEDKLSQQVVKDGTDRLLVKDEEIRDRWREYFDKLFNGESESPTLDLDDSFDDTNRRFVRRIQEVEIREALKRMKSRSDGP